MDSKTEKVVLTPEETTEQVENEEESGLSSNSSSEISISEQIVFESHEKRLRERMASLQTSIMNLKEQVRVEKELWKEDMEKIRLLQKQQEMKCTCTACLSKSKEMINTSSVSRNSSAYDFGCGENAFYMNKAGEKPKMQSIKQMLELQNYKKKLAETENMCSLELNRVKQSLDNLKSLQCIASEWGKNELESRIYQTSKSIKSNDSVQEIFVKKTDE